MALRYAINRDILRLTESSVLPHVDNLEMKWYAIVRYLDARDPASREVCNALGDIYHVYG